ncbi:hypothetical protein QBC38DRAFT_373189 [Podospora fimiseda]|uniref:F-box domain-containing protein n=1 Tax=Podospora fimiseda TaxID=252190 RepID=A0AAN7BH70_9PEZI|nr:hypothetical protein QBC38DRAFT_373189 [Podospora fimiseda]
MARTKGSASRAACAARANRLRRLALDGGVERPSQASNSTTGSRVLRPRKPHQTSKQQPSRKKTNRKQLPPVLNPGSPTSNCPLLEILPPELLNHINSFLTPTAQACLTLTCKAALHILGKESWSGCRERTGPVQIVTWGLYPRTYTPLNPVRQQLLYLLARDFSAEYCKTCDTLHPPLRLPQEHTITAATAKCFDRKAVIDYLPFSSGYKTGYSLVWNHIQQAMGAFKSRAGNKAEMDYLGSECQTTVYPAKLVYKLSSSSKKIRGNLVLKHEHKFQALEGHGPLLPHKVLNLPLRICPHQSTGPEHRTMYSWGLGMPELNRPFFTFSIQKAFPDQYQEVDQNKKFRKPTPSERKNMDALELGQEGLVFKCQYCPTKWKVDHDGQELKVTAWHCFYLDVETAKNVWPLFVRNVEPWYRNASRYQNITYRNCEYITGRYSRMQVSFKDFQIE